MGFNMNDIKLCKLVTGEVVVGKLVDNKLEECLALQAVPVSEREIKMGISPYFSPYSQAPIHIDIQFCMVITDADPELCNQYSQITSGISIVKPGDFNNGRPNLSLLAKR